MKILSNSLDPNSLLNKEIGETMKDNPKYTMPEIENCKKLFDDFMVKAKDFISKQKVKNLSK